MDFGSVRTGSSAATARGLGYARSASIEDWPWLDQQVLRTSRSLQVCMTCLLFRHHPGPDGIPLLTCHLHQGLIAYGEYLNPTLQRLDGELAPPVGLGA
jgi:hypothetical protein